MQLQVFSIRDQKAAAFGMPFFQKTKGEAIRNFQELSKDEKSLVAKYPEDFDLYHVGVYDDQTGLVKSLDTPQHVIKAVEVKS